MNEYFQPIPFGSSLPLNNPHAVSVSLPKLQHVIDYEEGDENAMAQMQSGYPRFFQNKLVEKLTHFVRIKNRISSEKTILPIASLKAKEILEYLVETKIECVMEQDCVFLVFDPQDNVLKICQDYIRNVGLLISSRKAEQLLYELCEIKNVFKEEKIKETSAEESIKTELSKHYSGVDPSDIFITNCGMNALYAAYQTIINERKSENRTTVVQLGWVYVDTIEILQKRSPNLYLQINIHNKMQLEKWLEKHHNEVAVLVTEVITNPLIQCVDLPWLYDLCKKYDIILIVDGTLATPINVSILPYCDIAIESLTKFACGNADVLLGAVILNTSNQLVKKLKNEFTKWIVPAFSGELSRLAFEIKNYENRVNTISINTLKVFKYLQNQTFIDKIYSVFNEDSFENFNKIKKSENAFPGLISIVFNKDFAHYYDHLNLPKGPSLGAEFTIAMPYVYLAHYGDIKSEAGLQKLHNMGIHPNLLRLSIGIEQVNELIEAFEKMKQSL